MSLSFVFYGGESVFSSARHFRYHMQPSKGQGFVYTRGKGR